MMTAGMKTWMQEKKKLKKLQMMSNSFSMIPVP
jgi:hypothetical protein